MGKQEYIYKSMRFEGEKCKWLRVQRLTVEDEIDGVCWEG